MFLAAVLSTTLLISLIAFLIFAPLPKLKKRLSPHDSVVKVRLNSSVADKPKGTTHSRHAFGFIFEFLYPCYELLSKSISKIGSFENEETLSIRLKQAGIKTSVAKYKVEIVKRFLIAVLSGMIIGSVVGSALGSVFCSVLAAFIILTKSKAAIDNRIEERRERIRLELYTVNQLLALHARTGSGIVQALSKVSDRTQGLLATEIRDVLNRVRAGIPIEDSLYLAAKYSIEPHSKRTFNLLASASQRGVDLTGGLLDLAKDLRRSIREDIKAKSTKRRAAMLLPTIGILAPIMLLFVSAPIPSIVLVGR